MRLKQILIKFLVIILIASGSSCAILKKHRRNYSLADKPRYANLEIASKDRSFSGSIIVASYNIKHSRKIDEAIMLFKKYGLDEADIISLQEMEDSGVKRIAEKFNFNYVYYPSTFEDDKDFGNAILSKWPILFDQKIILPHLDIKLMQRIAVMATIKIQDKKLNVISVHLGVNIQPNQRGDQINKILQTINPNIAYHVVAGDFNTFGSSHLKAVTDPFVEEGFVLATRNVDWTYNHWYLFNKKSLMDLILTKNMRIIDSGRFMDRSASDHLPIWTELKFSNF